jgi:hypothetical protein
MMERRRPNYSNSLLIKDGNDVLGECVRSGSESTKRVKNGRALGDLERRGDRAVRSKISRDVLSFVCLTTRREI